MPFGPGILLGLALVARQAKRQWAPAPLVMLLMSAAFTSILVADQSGSPGKLFSFESAAQSLLEARTDRLVFLWDNPNSQAMDPQLLAGLGGFFFQRAGAPVDVMPVKLKAGEDPNARLIQEAEARHAAILWIYDMTVNGTAARAHPENIEMREKSWACRNFGSIEIGIVACRHGAQSKVAAQ
jgi:hypothetical protein